MSQKVKVVTIEEFQKKEPKIFRRILCRREKRKYPLL